MEPVGEVAQARSADAADRELHARLLQADPTAPADLVSQYLNPLLASLRRAFPGVDDQLLETKAHDAILDVGERPATYHPDRRSLAGYLLMDARGDVLNALKSERLRTSHILPLDDVELRPPARNTLWLETANPDDMVAKAATSERVEAVRGYFDEQEWEVVQLIGEGERRSEAFAEILGLQAWPREQRDREVKRVKDRLKKRLQRVWRKLYGDD